MSETTPTPQETLPKRSRLRRGCRFALIGLIAGFLGLGTAAYRMSIESEQPPPPRKKEISEVLADTVTKAVKKLRKEESPLPVTQPVSEEWTASRKLGLVASILGFVGAAFGCVSWLVGEHRRWTWAALCIGVAALAWTHVVVAAAIAVGIGIVIVILGNFT